MIDLNDINSISELSPQELDNQRERLDRNELDRYNELIKNQYIEFNNLGVDLISDIDLKYKIPIFEEFLEFVDKNYTSIINIDEAFISIGRLLEIGKNTYNFVCINCYREIIPNYLEEINCFDIDQFDTYFKNRLQHNQGFFKASFAKTVNKTFDTLVKLQKWDENIVNDKKYQKLLNLYMFYIDLINYGDSSNFIFNYFRPVIIKNNEDIIGRIF